MFEIKKIHGAEAILFQGNNVILGVQRSSRWVMRDGIWYATIKTIGGEILPQESSFNALRREIIEEVSWFPAKDFDDIFRVETPKLQYRKQRDSTEHQVVLEDEMAVADVTVNFDQVSYLQNSGIELHGIFYLVRVSEDVELLPNDLPALCIMPLDVFLSFDFFIDYPYSMLQEYFKEKSVNKLIHDDGMFRFMIPNIVKKII